MKKLWNNATDFDRKVAKGAAIGAAVCTVMFVVSCAKCMNNAKKSGDK